MQLDKGSGLQRIQRLGAPRHRAGMPMLQEPAGVENERKVFVRQLVGRRDGVICHAPRDERAILVVDGLLVQRLRNPLGNAMGYFELLVMSLGDAVTDKIAEYIDYIRHSTSAMNTLFTMAVQGEMSHLSN